MEIKLSEPILEYNDRLAEENRALLAEKKVYMLDLMASPGAGKTSTILATIDALREQFSIAVIEGDIASDVDAQKIKAIGLPAVQINTGGGCHLEAAMIARALEALDLDGLDLIIVENVGNLVCPTDFDLGENAKVMILSVPEGDDKTLKYPGIFEVSQAVVLNKIDTLPVFNFDCRRFEDSVQALNHRAPIFPISALTKEGLDSWTSWLAKEVSGVVG
ncbi:MAG: hydrogenase nickel incorporation protein HypB [Coriobacteriales bacterium]|jgi:hydrogenase nickel incorporation protein HypB|nr:hydrogenase nickel incorporation protein HypB [Coriobacteriales bacterium]